MVENTIEYRAKIHERKMALSLSNKDIAKKAGYSLSSIDSITSGYRAKISDKLAAAIAKALEMPNMDK